MKSIWQRLEDEDDMAVLASFGMLNVQLYTVEVDCSVCHFMGRAGGDTATKQQSNVLIRCWKDEANQRRIWEAVVNTGMLGCILSYTAS